MNNELMKVISKMDAFLFNYTKDESRIDGYITGKSIVNNEERYVTMISINPQEPELFDMALDTPCSIEGRTLVMDYRLLSNDKIIDVLRQHFHNGDVLGIRIIPDKYRLTQTVLEKFNKPDFYGFFIATHSLADDVKNPSSYVDIREQMGLCQVEHTLYTDKETHDNYNIHITKKLSKEEVQELVKLIKQHSYQNIMVDFYDPPYYKDLLEMFQDEKLPENINIVFLGNPLYDEVSCFDGLSYILDNPITIHYNSCNDLNQMIGSEPHTEGVRYYSDIEASGITTSNNYYEMVKMLEEVVSYMEEMNYSPLEKIAYLNDYFKKNFIYDPDYQTTDHAENAHLDKVFRKDRMICEGFSNLYSAILRRAGILCFTYGTDDHQKNIVRVTDPKYGVDSIAIIDPTFDLSAENNRNVFANFLVPIDNDLYAHAEGVLGKEVTTPEVINIPSSLCMGTEFYNAYIDSSNPVYATNPIGYAIRMLQLMGLGTPENVPMTREEEIEYYKSALARSTLLDKIPSHTIAVAVHKVRKKEKEYYNATEEESDYARTKKALASRGHTHIDKPKIKLFNGMQIPVSSYKPSLEVDFVPTKAQPMIYQRPRKRQPDESNEEFSRYLHEFYDTMFYRRYEETMKMQDQKLEEFEIVEDTKEEIPEIVIYRDMDDMSRVFVTEEVLRRFHISEPAYKITIDGKTSVYEIRPEEATYIIDHANNKYAPYTVRFQSFDFDNEIHDTMKDESEETQENAPDEILIFRDVDDSGRAFVTKSTLERFHLETPGSKVFLGHMMVYEIDPIQAINIISNCNNEYAPYMIRYVSIEFDKPNEEKKEETKEETKPRDEILIFRDIENTGRVFVTKTTLNRFRIETPTSKVKIGRLMVYEIDPALAVEIEANADNEYAPYVIRYVNIEFDKPKEETKPVEKPRDEILIFRDIEDTGRAFVTKTTLSRFQIPTPSSKVNLGRMMVYEISPAQAIDIINNSNNPYAPYDIRYISIEFDKEDTKQSSETSNTYREDATKPEDNLIPGTNFKKPRVRRPYETDDHYVAYLEGYYDSIFGNEEDLFTPKKKEEPKNEDNLIPGTMYEKPRIRGNYETDEEYVEYLADYYNSIFGTQEPSIKDVFQPRRQRPDESDEDYVEYLAMFYGTPVEQEPITTRRK